MNLSGILSILYYIKNKPERYSNTLPALIKQPNTQVTMTKLKVRNSLAVGQPKIHAHPGIYIITNPLGRAYVGQSVNIKKRISHYRGGHCEDQPLIYNSLKKYGFKNHRVEVILYCCISYLNEFERLFIKKYKSNNRDFGLNLTSGGHDYFKHCKTVREKMSLAQMGNTKRLGKKASKEEIAKRVKKLKGKKRTPEQRKRISDSLKGRKLSKSHIRNMSIAFTGVNGKKVIDTETGLTYESATEAAKSIGLKKTTLTAQLNGQNRNKTALRYLK